MDNQKPIPPDSLLTRVGQNREVKHDASWKWSDVLANDDAQAKFEFLRQNEERNPFLPCGCMDG